jgi:hypothetical protein
MPLIISTWGQPANYICLARAIEEARLAFFRTLGKPDEQVWLPTAVPNTPGGPRWPQQPAWHRIRAGSQTIISSSGLTDPFEEADQPNLGYGVEVALATNDEIPEQLHPSWLLDLAVAVSNQAAIDGRFNLRAAKFGVFLFGAPKAPASYGPWLDRTGTLGFLVGVPIPDFSGTMKLPLDDAMFLMAKLLTPAEYEFIASYGPAGAQLVVERFAKDQTYHLSSLHRKSVV